MNNQERRARPKMINTNVNKPVFYPYSIKVNKCSRNCNNINDPYAKLCIPDVIKKINVKVFNLMSRINEKRHMLWHVICRFECKEDLVDKMVCDKGFSWNPSNCERKCDKSCEIREYLDYKSFVCKKTFVVKLVEECTSVIEENKICNETLNVTSSSDCSSCIVYAVLFVVFLLLCLIAGAALAYFYWYKRLSAKKKKKKKKNKPNIILKR